MRVSLTLAAALVALAMAPPLQADPAASLREALSSVPLLPESADGPSFADLTVAADVLAHRDLTGIAGFFSSPFGPISLAPSLGGSPAPDTYSETAWPELVGFAMDDIQTVVNYGSPPRIVTRLTLAPGVMPGVEAALAASGYDRTETGDGPLFRRGAEDYAFSLADRNPSDPFGGVLGQASRVLVQGDMLTRAPGMPEIEAGLTGPFWGERPDLAALLDMLSAMPQGTQVMRAQVLTSQFHFVPDVLEHARDDREIPPGIPPWRLGMMVELVEGKGRDAAALAAFVYATRDQAEAAQRGIEIGWNILLPGFDAPPVEFIGPATLHVEGDGPFVVVLHVAGDWSTVTMLWNIPFKRLSESYNIRELRVFDAPS